ELLHAVARDARALTESVEVEHLLPARDRPAPLALRAGSGGELLLDHAERQELVSLQPEDRLQPFDVVLREEPVAALGAQWVEETLILEIADLRDRDVRELVLEPAADHPDREVA